MNRLTKNNASISQYQLGLVGSTSAYGQTIPIYYGCTRGSVFLIWCAELRAGPGSSKAAKRAKKSTSTSYIENVDFLMGMNPIVSPLQFWQNQNQLIPLNFVHQQFSLTPGTQSTVTIVDSAFHILIGCTLTVPYSWTDLETLGANSTIVISPTGSFTKSMVGSYLQITGGTNFVHGLYPITGFISRQFIEVSTSPTPLGAGSIGAGGIAFDDYGAQGSVLNVGTYEIPLWNEAFAGPDRVDLSSWRNYPYVYNWNPATGGKVIEIDANKFEAWPAGTLTAYYTQLPVVNGVQQLPTGLLALQFEGELGEGPEFTSFPYAKGNPDFSAQQIYYPMYAGLSSTQLDLGVTQALPSILPEVLGAFAFYAGSLTATSPPQGDCDFADMIEDILKGVSQNLNSMGPNTNPNPSQVAAFSQIHHGLECYIYPGMIQKKLRSALYNSGGTFALSQISFPLVLTANDFAIVVARNDSGSALSISDQQGYSWTPMISGSPAGKQVWYATTTNDTDYVTVTPDSTNADIQLLEFNGLDTLDNIQVTTGTGGPVAGSITTNNLLGEPGYILAIVIAASTATDVQPSAPPPSWENVMVGTGLTFSMYRIVEAPGTYEFSVQPGFTGGWTLVLVAFYNSQPVSWPQPLGELLDQESLNLCRLQCRANGLWGSAVTDSQKNASDFLKDFYQAMNAAPVMTGFLLKSIPLSEVSAIGYGVVFTPPSAAGPIAYLQVGNFIGDAESGLLTIERSWQVDTPNVLQFEFMSRSASYNKVTIASPENATISIYGGRKDSPKQLTCVVDEVIAQELLNIACRKLNNLRNKYTFKLNAAICVLFEPMDLVAIPVDPQTGISTITPVRFTSIEIGDTWEFDCEAEPFMYGTYAPIEPPVGTPDPYLPSSTHVPAPVNAPVMFEPVPALVGFPTVNELVIVVSDSDEEYGGCQVYISTNGGNSYSYLETIQGNGITGYLTGDWPSASDPDYTNNLLLDLTESDGVLENFSVNDEDNFVYPCYVSCPTSWTDLACLSGSLNLTSAAGGFSQDLVNQNIKIVSGSGGMTAGTYAVTGWVSTNEITVATSPAPSSNGTAGVGSVVNGIVPFVPYELMTYQIAELTAAAKYSLLASITSSLPSWAASTAYVLGDVITDGTNDQQCVQAGTSGGTTPGWNTVLNGLTTDNDVIWENSGTGILHLRRGVFGAPLPSQGVDHPTGSRFAFLSPATPGGIVVELLPTWINKPLYFKFVPFNVYGGGLGSLATATAYPFTPVGLTTSISTRQNSLSYTSSALIVISWNGSSYTPFTITLALAATTMSFPTQAVSYIARSVLIANFGGSGTFYVTIYDPNYTGDFAVTWTDLASTHGSDIISSAAGIFTAEMIGSFVYFTAGTNFVLGPYNSSLGYEIIAVPDEHHAQLASDPTSGGNGSAGHAGLVLPTYIDSTQVRSGVPGYTFLGSYKVVAGNPPTVDHITPAGWPPPSQFLVNGS